MIAFLLATLAGAGWTRPVDPAEVQLIRLEVGAEVVVEVLEFDEGLGVKVQRVDDGSILELRWDQMLADDVRRIRASRGFLPDEPEPIFTDATKITLTTGVELVGILEQNNEETFTLRQGGKSWNLRWSGVRLRETVQVDALEVYDAEDLYTQKLYEKTPDTALDHYNLALYCESLQLWDKARAHLEQAREREPEFKASTVDSKLKRCELRMQSSEDSDLLGRVSRLANREEYDEAIALLEGFFQERADSPLLGEARREEIKLREARTRWLRARVVSAFFAHVDRYATRIAQDENVTAIDARMQMELEATKAALEMAANQFSTTIEETTGIWEAKDRPHASPRTASYGGGSFTLGKDLLFDGMDEKDLASAKEEEESERPAAGESLEDRIKKVIEERKRQAEERKKEAGKNKKQEFRLRTDVPPTQDEWWASSPVAEKKSYLMAYWAERDPHVHVIRVSPRSCRTCQGTGVLRFFDRDHNDGQAPCPRCKTGRVDRVVKFE